MQIGQLCQKKRNSRSISTGCGGVGRKSNKKVRRPKKDPLKTGNGVDCAKSGPQRCSGRGRTASSSKSAGV